MQNSHEKYKEQSVMTMTQGDILNLLLDEVINRLDKELACLVAEDYKGCSTYFQKSQIIVRHLSDTLDRQYDVTKGPDSLCKYFSRQTPQTNIKKALEPAEGILPVTVELKEASAQADRQARVEHMGRAN